MINFMCTCLCNVTKLTRVSKEKHIFPPAEQIPLLLLIYALWTSVGNLAEGLLLLMTLDQDISLKLILELEIIFS